MSPSIRIAAFSLAALLLAACSGGGGGTQAPGAVTPALGFQQVKTLRFTWNDVAGATYYRLLEDPDGSSGFQPVSGDIASGEQQYDHVVPLHRRINARYIVQSCNSAGCTDSDTLFVDAALAQAIGYVKAANTGGADLFGTAVALSADGDTLAVGAPQEDSAVSGIDGNVNDNSAGNAGAVYVFMRDTGGAWSQQAYVKASNTGASDQFGWSLALSADGDTLAVAARDESSSATGLNGDQADDLAANAGAVYVFTRNAGQWSQQAYVKASNTGASDQFGWSLALSADGDTLAVGARYEDSAATGLGGDQSDDSVLNAGAVYVFVRDGNGDWSQQAYVKAANTGSWDQFGYAVALSADGDTLAVGASGEDSDATGLDGNQANDNAADSGAVYVFTRTAGFWSQQAYVKASNTGSGDRFGERVALSGDGDTLAVGAPGEDSDATGLNGDQTNDNAINSGAVYVFTRSGTTWSQQAYVKAANTETEDDFGRAIALSADGDTLAVGASLEDGTESGLHALDYLNGALDSGAAYVFTHESGAWSQQAYVKASNTEPSDRFGRSLALSSDGDSLVVGAPWEDSAATGLGGDQTDDSAGAAGAVYLY